MEDDKRGDRNLAKAEAARRLAHLQQGADLRTRATARAHPTALHHPCPYHTTNRPPTPVYGRGRASRVWGTMKAAPALGWALAVALGGGLSPRHCLFPQHTASLPSLVDNRQRWLDRNNALALPGSFLPLAPPFRHHGRRTTSWEVSFQNVASSTERAIRPFLLRMARTVGLAP